MKLRPWVKLPTRWIEDGGLLHLRWSAIEGSANISSLILLVVITQHANPDTGELRATYDELSEWGNLSRAMVSAGLKLLIQRGRLKHIDGKQSYYALPDYDPASGWGKLPAAKLYVHGRVEAFAALQKRKSVELDAMKLYLLFVARRSQDMNMALLTYDQLEARSGINRTKIKPALSLLCAVGLIQIEHLPRAFGEPGVASGYRLVHIDGNRHMGTIGRTFEELEL